jgi:membrane dipeptidase
LRWYDGHLDLTYVALHGRDLRQELAQCGGTLLPATVTFPALRAAGVTRAVSTVFVRRKTADVRGDFSFTTEEEAFAAGRRQVEMHQEWEREGWIENVDRQTPVSPGKTDHAECGVRNAAAAVKNAEAATREIENQKLQIKNPLRVTLALEGAACVRSVADMDWFHAAGVRMVSLAWAEGSQWAGGDQSGGDITPAGRALVRRLDELGVVHDVSHLSERAFWTLLEIARGPVVASHSNCRALLPGAQNPERHLSDEQLRALAARGTSARIGVCLFARFLVPADELTRRRATMADLLRHMKHVEQVTGRRAMLALGSDFDSGFTPDLLPADLQGPAELWRLADALAREGWSDEDIAYFARGWEAVV